MNPIHRAWSRHVRPEHLDWTYRLLEGLYDGPGRFYHTRDHIYECLAQLNLIEITPADGTLNRGLAELALLWHDAVYVPGQPDNEINSAALLEGLRFTLKEPLMASHVIPVIFATQHKAEEGEFGNATIAAVVDIDLAILGAPSKVYEAYVSDVRREYGHVSDDAWRVGRTGFLKQMLARKRIYTLVTMRRRCEEAARANMQAELAHLTAPPHLLKNLEAEPLKVRHADLEPMSDSRFRRRCPTCREGALLVRRDQETFALINVDMCTLCAQRFIYLDETIGGAKVTDGTVPTTSGATHWSWASKED
jgi:predicted metal-dependent HD superfamily phosphohydrolase